MLCKENKSCNARARLKIRSSPGQSLRIMGQNTTNESQWLRWRRFQPAVTQTVNRKRQLGENSRVGGVQRTSLRPIKSCIFFSSPETSNKCHTWRRNKIKTYVFEKLIEKCGRDILLSTKFRLCVSVKSSEMHLALYVVAVSAKETEVVWSSNWGEALLASSKFFYPLLEQCCMRITSTSLTVQLWLVDNQSGFIRWVVGGSLVIG